MLDPLWVALLVMVVAAVAVAAAEHLLPSHRGVSSSRLWMIGEALSGVVLPPHVVSISLSFSRRFLFVLNDRCDTHPVSSSSTWLHRYCYCRQGQWCLQCHCA